MGHYLGDNAQEFYIGARVRPLAKLYVNAGLTNAAVGPHYEYTGKDQSGLGLPFLKTKEYEFTSVEMKLKYEVINDLFVTLGLTASNFKGSMASTYTAPFYYGKNGKTTTLYAGFNFGF